MSFWMVKEPLNLIALVPTNSTFDFSDNATANLHLNRTSGPCFCKLSVRVARQKITEASLRTPAFVRIWKRPPACVCDIYERDPRLHYKIQRFDVPETPTLFDNKNNWINEINEY